MRQEHSRALADPAGTGRAGHDEPTVGAPVRGERLLTLKQAMERLGCRTTKFYELKRRPDFPAVREGHMIREADLDEFIRRFPLDPATRGPS
jgi:hypothetical protein